MDIRIKTIHYIKKHHFTISELTLNETYTLKGENSY